MTARPYDGGSDFSGSISFSKVIELSWPINPGLPRWPGDPDVEFETIAEIEKNGYFLRRFSMGEHTGTHMSAGSSFKPDAPGLEAYSAQDLVRPAIVIDISTQSAIDPDYALTINDILDWESDHGPVPIGCLVLLHTGWQGKWHSPDDYLGGTESDHLHFPGFGLDAVEILLEGRIIAGLGSDTAGVEPGRDTKFSVSQFALDNQMIVLENLTNLDQLPPDGAMVVIGLLRLAGGSGCPVSVTALVP